MPLPNSPKLYLNEHLSPRLAAQLRKHGVIRVTDQETSYYTFNEQQGKVVYF